MIGRRPGIKRGPYGNQNSTVCDQICMLTPSRVSAQAAWTDAIRARGELRVVAEIAAAGKPLQGLKGTSLTAF